MSADLSLVAGIIIGVFAIPSLLNAFSESRMPRASVVLVVVAAGLVAWAIRHKPGGYSLADVPEAFVQALAYVIH